MILVVLIMFISLVLEGFITNFIPMNSNLLNSCFTVMSLIIIYPYLYNKISNYYLLAFILGLLVDIVYTNTLFLNAFIYVIIAFIIVRFSILIPNNLINDSFISIIIIAIYRIITYLLLNIIGYLTFDFKVLISSITSSIILNVIYIIILYLISNLVSSKLRINKID